MTSSITSLSRQNRHDDTPHVSKKPAKNEAKKPEDKKIKTLKILTPEGREETFEVKHMTPEQSANLENEVRKYIEVRNQIKQVDQNIADAKEQQILGRQMQALGQQKIEQGQQKIEQAQQMRAQGQQKIEQGQQKIEQAQQMRAQGQQMRAEATKKMILFCEQYINFLTDNKPSLSSESMSEECDSAIEELTRLKACIEKGQSVKQEMQELRPKVEKLVQVIQNH